MVDYSLIAVWAALVLAAAFVLDRDNDPQWKALVAAVVLGAALWRIARPGDGLLTTLVHAGMAIGLGVHRQVNRRAG